MRLRPIPSALLFAIVPFVAAPATLQAQGKKVIPAVATGADANDASYFPFVYEGGSRTQHLVAGKYIGATALIQSFAYRRDTANTNAFTARSIPNFTVSIGYSSMTPSTMSTTFANNRSGAMAIVFQGTYNRPAQPVLSGPAPFNVTFKLNTPFVYQQVKGSLLIEFVETGQANQKSEYLLDAFRNSTTSGATATFGVNGPFKSAERYSFTCPDANALTPGGALTLTASGLASQYPAAILFGFSNVTFSQIPLPFDLTAVGASGNFVYNSIDLAAPLPLVQSGNTWNGTLKFPIPADKSLADLTLFAQGLFIDAASNAFGSVWSNGVAMTLVGEGPGQMVYQSDSTSATGALLFGSQATGAPVIELTGSVQ
ncbi:MAG: hypothetical protein H6832_04290 [Planctomycetes bacterium]|nr:hypothetical protein [Planctomycetota bacterium]MCB9917601.1 hypothetical protein [Planctomycetota bacterium]